MRLFTIIANDGRRRLETGIKPAFRWYHRLAFYRESKQYDVYGQMRLMPYLQYFSS